MTGKRGIYDDKSQERAIAGLLRYGTWLASAIIAAGLAVELLDHLAGTGLTGSSGFDLVKAGVALFILLPVTRVALMLALFLRERDYAYAAISALVLTIIGASFLAGL
jgi:uncharacterized membrane protein